MALIDMIVGRPRRSGPNPATNITQSSTWNWRSLNYGGQSDDKALALTAVYRSIQIIAGTAAGLPLHVYKKNGTGERELAETDDVSFIWDEPNKEMTQQTYWEAAIGHETLGDAFLFVIKDQLDRPLSLWYVEPERVRTGRTSDERKVYEVDGQQEFPLMDYRADEARETGRTGEIVHVPNWGRNPLRGISPLRIAELAVRLGLSAQEYADRFFSQDATPRGLITTEQSLDEPTSNKLARQWQRQNSGPRGWHRTPVLSNGAKYQAVSVNPQDAQLLEERRFQLQEIGRLFGIPPHMLGDTSTSTSWGTGIEEQTRGMLTFTLSAHLNRFEQAISSRVLDQKKTGRYVKFSLGALLRPALLHRYQAYAMGYGRWLTANDVRALEDLPAVPGGDDLLAMTNLIPIDQLGVAAAATASPPAAAP